MQSNLDSFMSSLRSTPEAISTSQQVRDRGSIFLANAFTATSVKQAKDVVGHLRNVIHCAKRATHEISAWRCMVLKPGKSGLGGEGDFEVISGFDDDGEKYGGERILKIMKSYGVIDAVVIVSRWYGGILLGPVRFSHIEICAEEVCRQFKLREDTEECVATLSTLDDILSRLRAKYTDTSMGRGAAVSTRRKPDYLSMDLAKLRRLIGARENAIKSVKQLLEKTQ